MPSSNQGTRSTGLVVHQVAEADAGVQGPPFAENNGHCTDNVRHSIAGSMSLPFDQKSAQ
jgi:hypothetical protein